MDIISLFRMTNGLSTTRRYSQSRLHHEESVLEHTGFVVLVCSMVTHECNDIAPNYFDLGKVLSKATVHDLEEFITGDVPRPTKYFNPAAKAAFDAIAEHGMNTIMASMRMRPASASMIMDDWRNAKSDREGLIVKIADMAAVVWKMWSEIIMMNNLSLMISCEKVPEYISELKDYIEATLDNQQVAKYLNRLLTGLNEVAEVAAKKYNDGLGTANFEV